MDDECFLNLKSEKDCAVKQGQVLKALNTSRCFLKMVHWKLDTNGWILVACVGESGYSPQGWAPSGCCPSRA